MLEKTIWALITCLIGLLGTDLYKAIKNSPKRLRERREKERAEILDKIDNLKDHLTARMEQQDQNRDEIKKDVELLKSGNQAIIKNELKIRYEKWLKEGYAPVDAKDDLERMYEIYHKLGSNGVLTEMRNQFLALPNERVLRSKKSKEREAAPEKEVC